MANPQRNAELIPNPDPSEITTRQIEKSVGQLELRVMDKIASMEKAVEVFHGDMVRVPTQVDKSVQGLREIVETRLKCIENDVKGVHDYLDTRGKDIAEQVTHLRELSFGEIAKVSELTSERITVATAIVNERIKSLSDVTTQQFKSIVDTFAEKDKAVSVGLSAQKESAAAQQGSNTEATNKMESNFTKLLDQGRELLAEVRRNTELQINDLKANVTTLAARIDKGEGGARGSERTEDKTSRIVGQVIASAVAFVVIMTAIVGVVAFVVTRQPSPQVVYAPAAPQTNTR